ncbi:MAG: hypothetical protein KDE55_18730 [Novosphingobium sp.]|nr:hypothetical protein [Novosphingobium sp.]
MTVRPPRILAPREQPSPFAALEHELFEERAGTLIRVTKQFEKKLEKLKGLEPDHPDRAKLVTDTARALWMLAVQREVMGLPGGDALIRAYDIPADVRLASGIVTQKIMKGLHRLRR